MNIGINQIDTGGNVATKNVLYIKKENKQTLRYLFHFRHFKYAVIFSVLRRS